MNLRKWLPSVVMAMIVIVVGILMVSRLRDLSSTPRPSDKVLRQIVLDIGHDLGGPTFPAPQVVEKGVYADASARIDGIPEPVRLEAIVSRFEAQGFRRHVMEEGRRAVLCKGETVIDIKTFPSEGVTPATALVSANWGNGAAICR